MYKKRNRERDGCTAKFFSRGRQGQISIFVVIGIILLLALVLVIVLVSETTLFRPGEVVPTEKGKIERFITQCIESIGNDALEQIGFTGGYIDVPVELTQDQRVHLKISPFEVIPYWAHQNVVNIPSLSQIKQRIDLFMESELPNCLFDGELFTQEYDLFERQAVDSDVKITDKHVQFDVTYDIEIRTKDGKVIAELIDHSATSPVKLKQLHETAESIVEFELNDLKFEDLTLDMFALESPDVPYSGFEISCSKKKWNVDEVKQALKNMLRINVGKMKVRGTDFIEFPDSLPYYQNHYVWDILVDNEDIAVDFRFDDSFPFQFAVTPNPMKSGALGGEDASTTNVMSVLCLQSWKFTYDVSYPVHVKLIDQTTGYIFNSAFTVHIARNQANRGSEFLLRSPVIVDRFDSEEYCLDRNIPMTVTTKELIKNEDTGISVENELSGVDLEFSCLRYGCNIGESSIDSRYGPLAQYQGNFPYCAGGLMHGNKQDYKEDIEWLVTVADQDVELQLIPIKKMYADVINVVKHELRDGEIRPAEELSDEIVRITMSTDQGEEGHESTLGYTSEEIGYLEFLAKTDFTYDLEIQLFDDNKLVGGYVAEWPIDWETELNDAGEITFHVVYQRGFESDSDRFGFVGNLAELSELVPMPEIK